LILAGISGAVAFAVVLIVANSMAMSIRERTAELATLRALGFRMRHLLAALIAETLALSFAGAAVGSLGAWIICRALAGITIGGGLLVNLEVGAPGVLFAFVAAILISLLSTLVPALRAARTRIADALRFVG